MKILALRLSSAGDIVLLLPALEEIRAAYPTAEIVCVVKPAFAGLMRRCPAVSRVIEYRGFFAVRREASAQAWDAIIDFHGVLRTRLLAASLPARWKITYRKSVVDRYRLLLGDRGVTTEHVSDRYRSALKGLGIGLRRAAVFQTALLGDAVLTVPLIRTVAARVAPERLVVLTKPEHRFIFEREGFAAIGDDKHGAGRGLLGIFRMAAAVRRERVDVAVLPHRSLRSALIARLAGIPLRVGFDNAAGRFLYNRAAPFDHAEHDSERNLRLLDAIPAPAAAAPATDRFELALGDGERARAEGLWSSYGLAPRTQFVVGMSPGSSRETKKWLPERFIELGRRLVAEGPDRRVVLIGGEKERELCERVRLAIGPAAVNIAGRSALEDLPGLMSWLKLFVTNDSGPMHVAYGVGVPTVAVFGPTVKGFGFYPKGPLSRLIEVDLPCRPCGLHGGLTCPEGHFLCMRLVTTDDVAAACADVLAAREKCPG